MGRLIWMDDGCNLFVFSGASRRSTSQHFSVSGNMVNVRYNFLISCAFCLSCSSLTSDRSSRDSLIYEKSLHSDHWSDFSCFLCFLFCPFLWNWAYFFNPFLCLLLEIIALICVTLVFHQSLKFILFSSPAQQTASDRYSAQYQSVCTRSLISPHLWCRTTSADASPSWWCPPCEWQAPFPWRQRWSGARQTWLARQRAAGGRSTQCQVSLWTSATGCPGL